MSISKKQTLKDFRRKRFVAKPSVFVGVQMEAGSTLVDLQTRRPLLKGIRSLFTVKGNFEPYRHFLMGTDMTDMAYDWYQVGSDFRMAIEHLSK